MSRDAYSLLHYTSLPSVRPYCCVDVVLKLHIFASDHVTAILQRCQNGQKCVVLLLLCHTFYFDAISQELFEDTDIINTPIESLRPADVAFVGFVDIAPHFGGEIPPKPQFLEGE